MSVVNNTDHSLGQFGIRMLSRLVDMLQSHWKVLVVGIPFIWLLLFFLAPFIIVIKVSLAESLIASPPYSPLYERAEDGVLSIRVIFENYSYLWEDDLYIKSYINSVKIASVSTVLCLLIGYPMA
ncbi:MAG: putrescine transport system permease protein, partial [Oceanospirillaceae bacterium]